jgi:hypothetical protein
MCQPVSHVMVLVTFVSLRQKYLTDILRKEEFIQAQFLADSVYGF